MVISVTSIESSSKAYNVIPQSVHIKGTARTMDADHRDLAEKRLVALAQRWARPLELRSQQPLTAAIL